MDRLILIDTSCGQTRLAVMEDGELCELYIEGGDDRKRVGDIYVGRVMNVLPGMKSAFIDIGHDKNAYLAAEDAPGDLNLPIDKRVRPGDELMVQAIREPGGDKGIRVTTRITIPGRMMILYPTNAHVGISKKIEDEGERERLRRVALAALPEGMGAIMRTAAEGADEGGIADEIARLADIYEDVARRGRHAKAPALIREEDGAVERVVRDLLPAGPARIVTGDAEVKERILRAIGDLPEAGECEISIYPSPVRMFAAHGVEKRIADALKRRVWLKSGGYVVFDSTEALTAIDVNTGKFTGSREFSDTILKINLEAAEVIARQLRVRNIGGIVIVDFIDMDSGEHRERLIEAFARELKRDRVRINLVGFTGLGLIELTRKKTDLPLRLRLTADCPECGGAGRVPDAAATVAEILRELAGTDLNIKGGGWLVRAPGGIVHELNLMRAPCEAPVYMVTDGGARGGQYTLAPVKPGEVPQGAVRMRTDDRR